MIPFVPVLAQITIRWRLDWLSLLIGFVLGLLLGVPTLMMIKALCDRVDGLEPIGELLGR